MSGRRHYEARAFLGRDLYSRVVAEMAARNGRTISATIRQILSEYFAMREELASTLEVGSEGEAGGRRIGHRMLAETEARLVRTIEGEQRRLDRAFARLTAMIEHLDLDLMTHLPEIAEDLRDAAEASGRRRHLAWLDRVERGRRSGEERTEGSKS